MEAKERKGELQTHFRTPRVSQTAREEMHSEPDRVRNCPREEVAGRTA